MQQLETDIIRQTSLFERDMLGSEERKNIEIQALKEAKEKEIKDIDDKIKDLKADLARLRPQAVKYWFTYIFF